MRRLPAIGPSVTGRPLPGVPPPRLEKPLVNEATGQERFTTATASATPACAGRAGRRGGSESRQLSIWELLASEALLLGRVTYQGFAQAWPSVGTDDFGKRMNDITKYVVSSRLTEAEATWGSTTVIGGDVVAEITKLKAQPGGDLLVEGSAQLAQTLIRHGLVDDYRLMVFPVILGAGKRLFPPEMTGAARLTLTDAKPDRGGVMLLTYQPALAGAGVTGPA